MKGIPTDSKVRGLYEKFVGVTIQYRKKLSDRHYFIKRSCLRYIKAREN